MSEGIDQAIELRFDRHFYPIEGEFKYDFTNRRSNGESGQF